MFDFQTRLVSNLTKDEREAVASLLSSQGLIYEEGADETAIVENVDGRIVATASLFGDVIRMVAVDASEQESGLSAVALSSVLEAARVRGVSHLFVYTKSDMAPRFASLGFRSIASTETVSLLEIGEPGIGLYRKYLAECRYPDTAGKRCGAIVVNCNPFTRGHRYLIEKASEACDFLYVIVVEANLSAFSFDDRLAMVRLGTRDLENVAVLRSGSYAVSAATFPTYFLKERGEMSVAREQTRLDLDLFTRLFVPALDIAVRFVGTEPESVITNLYNEAMKETLPPAGVAVCEIERIRSDAGDAISASRVRRLLAAGETQAVRAYLPETTIAYLEQTASLK